MVDGAGELGGGRKDFRPESYTMCTNVAISTHQPIKLHLEIIELAEALGGDDHLPVLHLFDPKKTGFGNHWLLLEDTSHWRVNNYKGKRLKQRRIDERFNMSS